MSVTATEVSFRQSATANPNPGKALDDLDRQLRFDDSDAVILFVSSEYKLEQLQKEIAGRIHVPLLCCTTAGEISSSLGYSTGGISAAAIGGCRAKLISLPELSEGIAHADSSEGETQLSAALTEAEAHLAESEPDESSIGLIALDGLCRREELVIERLQLAMPTVPIVGGSAGDACQFKRTMVFIDGQFQSNAGALLLLSGPFTAIPFQTHHYASTGMRVVATEVDAPNRRLLALDGIPASHRLAQLLGCRPEEITAERLATKPLMLRCGDTFYVRGVQAVHPDGAISFYSALREGEVLHISRAGDIVDTMASYLEALRNQNRAPDLVLGFDCIARRLELAHWGNTANMNRILAQVPFVGFSTFGEQYHGQHVNQTMTGVALWNH